MELRNNGPEAGRLENETQTSLHRSIYLPLLRGLLEEPVRRRTVAALPPHGLVHDDIEIIPARHLIHERVRLVEKTGGQNSIGHRQVAGFQPAACRAIARRERTSASVTSASVWVVLIDQIPRSMARTPSSSRHRRRWAQRGASCRCT